MWVRIWVFYPLRIPVGGGTSDKKCIYVAGGSVSIAVALQALEEAPGTELSMEKGYYTRNKVACLP